MENCWDGAGGLEDEAESGVQGCKSDTTLDDDSVARHEGTSGAHDVESRSGKQNDLKEREEGDRVVLSESDNCENLRHDRVSKVTNRNTTENDNERIKPNAASTEKEEDGSTVAISKPPSDKSGSKLS